MDEIQAIRDRAAAATPGPWRWFGNTEVDSVYLATTHSGRLFVLMPDVRKTEYVYNHDSGDGYSLDEARDRVQMLCGAHGEDISMDRCRCQEIREFLAGSMAEEGGHRDFIDRNGEHGSLSRGVGHADDLRFAVREVTVGGLMFSYRDMARYEVLGGLTREENDKLDKPRELYREDIVGIDNPDAEFIAHAREDIEVLLAEIDRLNLY